MKYTPYTLLGKGHGIPYIKKNTGEHTLTNVLYIECSKCGNVSNFSINGWFRNRVKTPTANGTLNAYGVKCPHCDAIFDPRVLKGKLRDLPVYTVPIAVEAETVNGTMQLDVATFGALATSYANVDYTVASYTARIDMMQTALDNLAQEIATMRRDLDAVHQAIGSLVALWK